MQTGKSPIRILERFKEKDMTERGNIGKRKDWCKKIKYEKRIKFDKSYQKKLKKIIPLKIGQPTVKDRKANCI